MDGQFRFQGYNKRPKPYDTMSQNRVSTILTNARKRGGTKGPVSRGPVSSDGSAGNALMKKFLRPKGKEREYALQEKISIEDRKKVKEADIAETLGRFNDRE